MFLIKKKKKGRKNSDSWDEVAYWRKANQIHKWFVDNVQKGEDDCGYYKVSKKKLEELRDLCKSLKKQIIVGPGKILYSETFKNGKWEQVWENGKTIINQELCEELLPTTSGFFFGSTDYNQYYIEDIENTIKQLERVLKETDFDNEYIVYTSSW